MQKPYKIALMGNPNCGKTTLFNALTKMRQSVGNWTGVTVEKKSGAYYKNRLIEIIDLPGVYALSPYSPDEKIAADYLLNQNCDLIINVIDSTNLERSLNLTLQLLDTGINTVLALNMSDELNKRNMSIDLKKLEEMLHVKTVLISAAKKINLSYLMDIVLSQLSKENIKKGNLSSSNPKLNFKTEKQKDIHFELYEKRYKHAEWIVSKVLTKKVQELSITEKIDKVITNKYLAFPIFFLIIWFIYFISVQLTGKYVLHYMERGLDSFIIWIKDNLSFPSWANSLITEGVLRGMGTVLTFLPQIIVLFFFISLLEGSGYMARVAYIMDKLFTKIGLSGKSFIPMIMGCGCSVPAILSSKTIKDASQKRLTIILTPFVPCSAKLPIFALFVAAFFPKSYFAAPSMYFLGIIIIVVLGFILKNTKAFSSEGEAFIMELPPYRVPLITNILMSVWQKSKSFVLKVGSLILLASVVIWFFSNFNYCFQMVDAKYSLLASLGRLLSPLFIPLGFGDWKVVVALLSGTIAKETVISSFSVLLGSSGNALVASLKQIFSPLAAYSFMTFVLLNFPCVAALAATKKEIGSAKWLFVAMALQFLTAYAMSYLIYNVGGIFLFNKWLVITPILLTMVVIVGLLVYKRLKYKR
ncbi:MAG: ferrous iron transport protein B [Bacillota bacterium]